ncbi:MAG: terminase B protein [Magnetococcales bacterium]|nr:terminase B protein [Magnetococcales bacterium]HIJ83739.1 terminase [Magnetococcales bacterium]
MKNPATPEELQQQLAELLADCSKDPLKFVQLCFPWGTGDLTDHTGPDPWQTDVLQAITTSLRGGHGAPVRVAVASGHGIGKSALVAWLMLWSIMTFEETKGVVTANTENQLKTKTWAELAKWRRRCLGGELFRMTATALFAADPKFEKTWRIDMVPWSERNTEAFAGLHNEGKRVALFFDEASAIPDSVWEVAEGAMTDANTEILWCCFGNPTLASGRFHSCFGRFKHRWITRQIDSRTCRLTNKGQIQQWIDDYGEDSDFARVRVRGLFPRSGSNQFIPGTAVERCRHCKAQGYESQPRILGIDVARFGEDQTVFALRQGRKLHPLIKMRGLDTTQTSARAAKIIRQWRPHAVFVDGVGIGGSVVDQLRQLGFDIIEINAGHSAMEPQKYFNLRAEMWGRMRDALIHGMELPDDPELLGELTSVEYGFSPTQQVRLEKKEMMKRRGLSSPDCGDALALTFSRSVAPFHEDETACYPEDVGTL